MTRLRDSDRETDDIALEAESHRTRKAQGFNCLATLLLGIVCTLTVLGALAASGRSGEVAVTPLAENIPF